MVSYKWPLHCFSLGLYLSLISLFVFSSFTLPILRHPVILVTTVEKWQPPILKPFALPASLNPIASVPTLAASPKPSTQNPFRGAKLYHQPTSPLAIYAASQPANNNLINKIATQPTAIWLGDWTGDPQTEAANITAAAAAQNSLPVLVAYNIPKRDCGNYSSGGATSADTYKAWINQLAAGIGSRRAVVILEPDSLGVIDCLSSTELATRYALLSYATHTLTNLGHTSVYIDAGHSNWLSPGEIASRLKQASIQAAQGFATNISNFYSNAQENAYGVAVSKLVGDKHFIIDTGRNGLGGSSQWCNPEGRALGTIPQAGSGLLDAYLWVKTPGESDGTCNGGPPAGTFWPDYALGLASRASY